MKDPLIDHALEFVLAFDGRTHWLDLLGWDWP